MQTDTDSSPATTAEKKVQQSCPHKIPPSLLPHLPTGSTCPSCTVQHHIDTIKSIQSELLARGGIFVSRPRTRKNADDVGWTTHVSIRDRWRSAKIKLLNDVMKFEDLSSRDAKSQEKEWSDVDEALRLWDQEKEGLAEVPGYVKEMSTQEVSDIVKRMMDQLRGTIEGMIDEDGDSAMADADAADEEEDADCPFPDSDVDLDSDEEGVSELGDVDSEADEEEKDQTISAQPEDARDSTRLDSHANGEQNTEMDLELPDSNSINSIERPGRRVRFTDFALVCPDSHVFVPSLFPHDTTDITSGADALKLALSSLNTKPSTSPTLLPHRRRVDADRKRLKARFKHTSGGYHAGKWASPVGYIKPNTSWYKLGWKELQKQWAESEQEEIEEQEAFDQLKAIAGTWILTRMLGPALWCLEETLKKMQDQNEESSQE
ncbi:hypothetical protein K491DRAFT_709897 [Lophiostoma macrostomum CBS 122681]|uniref:Uncharacterized protein n=1 Tax=Lophiostoma macrostomum CBS 122681 TaxID=1314788 RepID=A0A6A6TRV3_9PLEO|nr:hypothetical protein K491DRAFT_709897 [Lophiostoma macrostomum CBS 122681]